EVLERWGRDAVILAFASAHYRQPMQFSDAVMEQAQAGVARIREAGRAVRDGDSPPDMAVHREAFFAALADDFNTPQALAALWAWVREANRRGDVGGAHLREMLTVLALENLLEADEGAPAEVVELAQRRREARAARDFAEADRLRDAIAAAGWAVRDTADGFELTPA
ncbi:MAG TPA: DALR domain-containing protein, partial [Capillimicrobium sp.]